MTGSAVSEPLPAASPILAARSSRRECEVEHVARIGFAARRAAQQQRHLAVGDGLLGQVVIDDHGVHAVVAEILAHGAAGERREELHRRRRPRRWPPTTIEYSSAPRSSSTFTNWATVERFWPTAT